ncbi:MAG: MarR family transcriptional regulator [Pseudomonadota bacterium]
MADTDKTLDFGPLDDMIGIALQRAFFGAYGYFNAYMGPDFKPGFYSTLALLLRNPGISQKQLAAAIRRDKSTLVPFLNKMEADGWVVRKRSQSDGRAHELYLTSKGEEVVQSAEAKVKTLEATLSTKMGEDDFAKLLQLLRDFDEVVAGL